MCDVCDVIESSYSSADVIVSTVYDFGGKDLGNGIRKLAGEMLTTGQNIGYDECFEKAVPVAYDLGKNDGRIEGSIIAVCVCATVTAVGFGIYKLVSHIKSKKAQQQEEDEKGSDEQEEIEL